MKADLLEDLGLLLGEGPQLFPDGTFRFVDLLAGTSFIFDGFTSRLEHRFPQEVGKILPWEGGTIALTKQGLEFLSPDGTVVGQTLLTDPDSPLRLSDGVILPDGSVAFGILHEDLLPGWGSLMRVAPDGDLETIVEKAAIPNGIAVMASGKQVVWTDSPTQTLTVFDIDPHSGSLVNPRPWATIPEARGIPDGLCADAEGGVWVALWSGGQVVHLDASGTLDQTIELPVQHVTSVSFDFHDNLVITSGCVVLSEEERRHIPGAGGLWGVPAAVHLTRGLPVRTATLSPREASTSSSNAPHHTLWKA